MCVCVCVCSTSSSSAWLPLPSIPVVPANRPVCGDKLSINQWLVCVCVCVCVCVRGWCQVVDVCINRVRTFSMYRDANVCRGRVPKERMTDQMRLQPTLCSSGFNRVSSLSNDVCPSEKTAVQCRQHPTVPQIELRSGVALPPWPGSRIRPEL